MARSVPQQLVDAGLGAGALVDRLTITAQAVDGPGWPFFRRPAGQAAGHHHANIPALRR